MKYQLHGPLPFIKIITSTFLLTVLVLLIMALSMPFRSVSAAGPITVDRTDDPAVTTAGSGAATCTGAVNDCSLRGAVIFANANPGTTINVPAGTYPLTIDGNSEGGNCGSANIGDLDIAGNNTSMVGAGAATTIINQTMPDDRVICVDQNLVGNFTFSISGVTISGGRETHGVGGGGIISGDNGDVTNVTNVVFSNNLASGSGSPVGGGLGNEAGTLNVISTTFNTNQSVGSGGGLYYSANGGTGSLSLTNSTFTNNVTTGGDGGAIKTTSTSTPDTISHSTFTGNQAQGATATGGAVANESGPLNIDHSIFVNNQVSASSGRGGAIGSKDGANHNVTITFSRFVGNTAATGANGKVLYGGSSSTMTANDNWWGVNTGPATNDRAGTTIVSNYLTMTNTASPNPILINQTTTLKASFLLDSASNPISTSDLSVLIGLPMTWGSAIKGTLSSLQTTVQANGTATAKFTANAAGAGSARATVDTGTATANITINKANTTTSLSSDTPDPSVTGQPVTVAFSVSSSTGGSPTQPTGTVTISDGTNSCKATVASGSCIITFSSAGNKSLTATYPGDSNFISNLSPVESHTVNPAATTTKITSDNPDPSVVGQTVTFNFSVVAIAPGVGTPTGNVTVSDGGSNSCTASVATGTCSIKFTKAGSFTLTATYAGDSNFKGSTSTTASHTVNAAT